MGPALLTRLFNMQGDMVARTDGQMENGIAFFLHLSSLTQLLPQLYNFYREYPFLLPMHFFAVTSETHRALQH